MKRRSNTFKYIKTIGLLIIATNSGIFPCHSFSKYYCLLLSTHFYIFYFIIIIFFFFLEKEKILSVTQGVYLIDNVWWVYISCSRRSNINPWSWVKLFVNQRQRLIEASKNVPKRSISLASSNCVKHFDQAALKGTSIPPPPLQKWKHCFRSPLPIWR